MYDCHVLVRSTATKSSRRTDSIHTRQLERMKGTCDRPPFDGDVRKENWHRRCAVVAAYASAEDRQSVNINVSVFQLSSHIVASSRDMGSNL